MFIWCKHQFFSSPILPHIQWFKSAGMTWSGWFIGKCSLSEHFLPLSFVAATGIAGSFGQPNKDSPLFQPKTWTISKCQLFSCHFSRGHKKCQETWVILTEVSLQMWLGRYLLGCSASLVSYDNTKHSKPNERMKQCRF